MPTPTYTPLAELTLGSATSSVTFSSISQIFRDLVLVISYKTSTADGPIRATFNSDSGSSYQYFNMVGNGSSATSDQNNGATFIQLTGSTNTPINSQASVIANVFDYAQTDKHKNLLSRADVANSSTSATVGRWKSTAAVNTILLTQPNGNFASGSTFALYGVSA